MPVEKAPQAVHPLCPLISGCRLYYILLRLHSYESIDNNLYGRVLKKLGLSESSCSYLIFGDADFLIRVWAPEKRISKLILQLHDELNVVPELTKVLLVNEMSTWYQREIEKRHPFACEEVLAAVPDVLAGTIPSWMKWPDAGRSESPPVQPAAAEIEQKPLRFFLVLTADYTTKPTLYRDIVESGPNNLWREKAMVKDVSVYSFQSGNEQGVLIKGSMPSRNLQQAGREVILDILHRIRDHDIRATTYICAQEFNNNSNLMPALSQGRPRQRYNEILKNLLRSGEVVASRTEDAKNRAFREKQFGLVADEERESRMSHFLRLAEEFFDYFWLYDQGWQQRMTELRLLYRWVLQGPSKDEQLAAVILRGLTLVEKRLRDFVDCVGHSQTGYEEKRKEFLKQLQKHVSLKLSEEQSLIVLELARKNLQILTESTLEPMIKLLPAVLKVVSKEVDDYGAEKLVEQLGFIELLKGCVSTRNFLAHGVVGSLFDERNGKELWETHVINYAKLMLVQDVCFSKLQALGKSFRERVETAPTTSPQSS